MLFYPKNMAFGLDIGDRTVKLAEIRHIKNLRGEERLVLTSYNEASLPDAIIQNGEIKNAPAVIQTIKNCVKSAKGKFLLNRAVVASLPESQSYLKIVSLPKKKDGNIEFKDIESIIDQHFPIEADKLYFDWQAIDSDKIMINAAPKNIVDSYIDVIEQAGLIPVSLELESTAISRALIDKNDSAGGKPKIFMDLGATRSSIIAIYQNNPILTLNIPLAGEKITQKIAASEKVPFEKAEETKLSCGFDLTRCSPKIKKIISLMITDSVTQIETGLRYINRLLRTKIDKVLICGGGSAMSKLTSILSDKLKIKVRHADPLINVSLDKKVQLSNDDILRYVTAIGLAMRGTETDILIFNKDNL